MDYFINVSLIETYQVSLLDNNPEIATGRCSVDDALEDALELWILKQTEIFLLKDNSIILIILIIINEACL